MWEDDRRDSGDAQMEGGVNLGSQPRFHIMFEVNFSHVGIEWGTRWRIPCLGVVCHPLCICLVSSGEGNSFDLVNSLYGKRASGI